MNDADQQIYKVNFHSDSSPKTITDQVNTRFADLQYDNARDRIIAVAEYHAGNTEPLNSIVSINISAKNPKDAVTTLVEGDDFYAYPSLSPSGEELVWLSWNHPNMPWDSTQLWQSKLNNSGAPVKPKLIAGDIGESLFQPRWSPDGELHFVSDQSNWWNIYRRHRNLIKPVAPMEAEFGLPLWQFGMSTYDFFDSKQALCCYSKEGCWDLALFSPEEKRVLPLKTEWNWFSSIDCSEDEAVFLAASPNTTPQVVRYSLKRKEFDQLTGVDSNSDWTGFISQPKFVSFPVSDSEHAYGFFYPPCNASYVGPHGDKPPLIVLCHGGPTGSTSTTFNLKVQFWTSRGFAVFDVNYRGSTGFGRDYRHKLYGQWGLLDVEDASKAARYATAQGWVSAEKRIIRGSSAGGYTVLAALTFTDTFNAGCSVYGIGDLEILAKETHKFESRYGDSLIGPYPEEKHKYVTRSPLNFVEKLNCPVIFFQGMKDKVVPPNQATLMSQAIQSKGLPVALITYDNEAHGFRDAQNIVHSLNSELAFYGKIFGFITDSNNPELPIENMDDWK